MKEFIKKNINKIILVLLILNIAIIYFIFVKVYHKNQTIKMYEDSLIEEISIDYEVQANPLSKVEVKDLSNTNAGINSCVGNLGQSLNISGNFFNFQLHDATVSIKYDESKLEGLSEENIGILWYDQENEKMVEIQTDVNIEENKITFNTNHFSEYILVDLESWRNEWNKRLVREKDENASAFDIAFVIDDSGSMQENDPQDARLVACEDFVKILRNKDGYSVISFEYGANLIQELTTDKGKVESAIENFNSSGGTNIASGLQKGIETLDTSDSISKVIVLLTDGEDTGLTSKKENIISDALAKEITIYSIFLNAGKNEINTNNTIDIQDIANRTGGKFYYISSDEVVEIFKEISKEAVGVENGKDTDGDGIIDEIEIGGIRNQFGQIIFLDPYNKDTDGDGIADNEEIGEKVEYENGEVYYKFVSDPLVANDSLLDRYVSAKNGRSIQIAKGLATWDSGFELNKNGFQFRNISVNSNGGVCAGISYVVEKTFNGEEIDHSIEEPQIPEFGGSSDTNETYEYLNAYPELQNFLVSVNGVVFQNQIEKSNSKNIEELKKNPGVYVIEDVEEAKALFRNNTAQEIEAIYENKLVYFYNSVDGFEVNDENIRNGNMYFYNPTGILKSYTSNNSSPRITYAEQTKDDSDGNLIRELFYYWMYENHLTMEKKQEYMIDYSQPITEETITKLKSIFSSKKIIRIDIKGHTINGYALEKVSESEYRIYVYDSNYPYYREKNPYIRLLKAYGRNNEKVYVIGEDKIYNYEGSQFVDTDGTFTLLLEKGEEILNYDKIEQ